jgi:cytochrome d ubiquinol oxidase subunit II
MIGQLDHAVLQVIWWLICSLVGGLFIFMTFVQGGQTLLMTAPRDAEAKSLMINSLGRKWEIGFTTLVLFGGALFAAFPLFYASSFGGAYWVWILILLTFVVQAVSYEFRKKPGNFLGARTHEIFLFINGSVGLLLIGAAIGTFFTGSNFQLNDYNLVTWQHPLRGLEAAFSLFNLSLGLFLVFHARTLGSMYLVNNLIHEELEAHLRKAALNNLLCSLPFLLYVLISPVHVRFCG